MASTEPIDPAPANPPATPVKPRIVPVLAWMAIGCVLLAGSGLARSSQDRRHQVESSYTEDCPFPLKSIPTTLGRWKVVDGGERTLDSLTMRITGGSAHLMRTYVDELTGVTLMALVLFGPAEPVIPHTPEVCYPSSGFQPVGDSADRVIESKEAGIKSVFRSAAYSKSGGRAMLHEGVYYSFRLEGQWSPYAGSGRKFPRRNPSVFKVQVQRQMAPGEKLALNDPIESFLSLLVPAIERGIESGGKPARASVGDVGRPVPFGDPAGELALAPAGQPRPGDRAARRARSAVAHRLGHPADQHRGAPDQADEQEDRGEVDRQGQLRGEPDGIAGLAGGLPGVGQAAWGNPTLGTRNHRRHSLTSLDLSDSGLSPA